MSAPPHPADDHRAERVSLLAGVGLVALVLFGVAVLAFVKPDLVPRVAVQISTHALVGRETGIPAGFFLGIPVPLVAAVAAAQDLAILLIGYPLVLMAGRGALRIPFLDRVVHKPHPSRDRFAKRTESGGVALLALSLWVPFLPSGALIASLLGRAAGYRPRVFLPALALSALGADLVYVVLAHRVGAEIGFGKFVLVAFGIVLAVGIALFVHRKLRRA